MNHRLRRWGKNESGRPMEILVLPPLEGAGHDLAELQVCYDQVSGCMLV